MEVIEQICKEDNIRMDPITEKEVKAALKRLNNNKAVDVMGLTAEHFKLAGQELSVFPNLFPQLCDRYGDSFSRSEGRNPYTNL